MIIMKHVSIIIVNWNKKDQLELCLSSLKKTKYDNFSVVVVDNGSKDGSANMVKQRFPMMDLIEEKENFGFSKGTNIGIKYAITKYNPDFILLLNNDIEIREGKWLNILVEITNKDGVGIASCKLLNPDGTIQYAGSILTVFGWRQYTSDIFTEDTPMDMVIGACFLIKREVIETIGLLDEGFTPYFWEETDYCARARKAGYKIIYTPRTTVIHYGSVSLGDLLKKSESYDYVRFYVSQKNRIRYQLLNFPLYKIIVASLHQKYFPFVHIFLEKKDKSKRYALNNLVFTKHTRRRLQYFFKAYLINIKNIKEIMYKRSHRIEKIWN